MTIPQWVSYSVQTLGFPLATWHGYLLVVVRMDGRVLHVRTDLSQKYLNFLWLPSEDSRQRRHGETLHTLLYL